MLEQVGFWEWFFLNRSGEQPLLEAVSNTITFQYVRLQYIQDLPWDPHGMKYHQSFMQLFLFSLKCFFCACGDQYACNFFHTWLIWTSGYLIKDALAVVEWGSEEGKESWIAPAATLTYTQHDMCGKSTSQIVAILTVPKSVYLSWSPDIDY